MPAFSGKGVEYGHGAGEVKSAARAGPGEVAWLRNSMARSRARRQRAVADADPGPGAAWDRPACRLRRALRGRVGRGELAASLPRPAPSGDAVLRPARLGRPVGHPS